MYPHSTADASLLHIQGPPVGHFGWIAEKDGLRLVDFDKEKLSAEPPGHRALLGSDPS